MRNRCVIDILVACLCCNFAFGVFCGCRGLCHRNESGISLCLLTVTEDQQPTKGKGSQKWRTQTNTCHLIFRIKYLLQPILITSPPEIVVLPITKRPSGAPPHTSSKFNDAPLGFVNPPPSFEIVYCFIWGRPRWLLLVIGWFIWFLWLFKHF